MEDPTTVYVILDTLCESRVPGEKYRRVATFHEKRDAECYIEKEHKGRVTLTIEERTATKIDLIYAQ